MKSQAMRTLATLLTLGLLALPASGCGKGAKGECPQLDICGGSPMGSWKVSEACQVPAVRPAQPEDVTDFTASGVVQAPTIAPPPPNPIVNQQTTSGDWCSSLVFAMDGSVRNANLFHTAPPLKSGTMIFGPNDYVSQLIFSNPKGTDMTHFARRCLVANGNVNPTCADLATALNTYYKPTAAVPPTFGNITCAAASDGGCDCTYDVTIQVDDSGQWGPDPTDNTILRQDSTLLTFNGAVMNAAASTTMLKSSICATPGQALELSGVRGGSLSNVQGLRTLVLTPM
jgi:hypothetical protein